MTSQEFLATVLPTSGLYCSVEISTAKKEHVFVETVEELYNASIAFSDMNFNAFYGLATFKTAGKRVADNAMFMRSLFLDIDCGEGKDYDSKQAAAAALDIFLSESGIGGLGSPYIVSSGGGLHVYFPLTQDVTIDVWKPVAENLKRLCKKLNFNIDHTVTADAARILRVPDTYNYKQEKPRKVKIMVEGSVFELESLAECIKNKLQEMGSSLYELPAPQLDIPGKRLEPTSNSVKLMENSVTLFKNIKEACGQFKYYEEHATEDGMEPLWRGLLSIVKTCDDVDKVDIGWKLSELHPYPADRFNQKWQEIKGPYPCLKLDSENPGICEGCKHFGKITNPLALGREVMTNTDEKEILVEMAPVAEDVPAEKLIITRPTPPRGFSYGDNGGIFIQKDMEDADGTKTTKNIVLLSYDLFVVDVLHDAGEHVIHLIATRPEGAIDIMLQQKSIISKDETLKALASQNVIAAHGSLDKELFYYVRACVEHASSNKRPVKVPANYGWQKDKTFVYNSRVYHPDGRKVFVPMPGLVNINNACVPTGTIEEWRKPLDMVIKREIWDVMTLSLVGPASALVEFTGFNGMVYHMCSKDSGTGKSLAQEIAASFWGNPESYKITAGTSVVALQQRMGMLNSLPLITDEITNKNQNDFEWFPENLMDKSQGKGKERMESGANKERANTTSWKSLDLFSSNTYALDYLGGARKHASQAAILRFLERRMEKKLQWSEADIENIKLLKANYGVAADKFVTWAVANRDVIQQVVDDTYRFLKEEFNSTNDERFWSCGNVCIVAMARLLGRDYLDIIDLPIKPILETLKGMIDSGRACIIGNKRTAEDVLNAYTRENYGKFVVLKNDDGTLRASLGGQPIVDASITRSQVAGRIEHDVTPGHVDYFIEEQLMKAYCVTMTFNYADFKKEIENMPHYKVNYLKKDMLSKTRGPTMRVNAMKISQPLHLTEGEDESALPVA